VGSEDVLRTRWLGSVRYRDALVLQRGLRDRSPDDHLLLLEHPHVYTLGLRTDPAHLLVDPAAVGAELERADRGGDVTYHGPGQLVGYPIMHVTDVPAFVRTMERAIVTSLADEGIEARGRDHEGPAYTGVWVEDRKIASIGVHISRGVSAHGFAINVDNDVEPFHQVTACGLPGVRMTSVALETGRSHTFECMRRRTAFVFANAHGLRQRIVTPARIGATRPAVPSLT
jgi:lipoyl(octanoyl) transferase